MAGNKALEKFKDSKTPKKGASTTTVEVPIYQEPNTHSKIIGTIKKDEKFNWISKSICDEKEWVRCDNKHNFGYVIIKGLDGTVNINFSCIQEKKEEEKIENKNNENQLSKIEEELAQQMLNEILEEDEKKNDSSNSTEIEKGNNSSNFDCFEIDEKERDKIFNDINDDEIFGLNNESAFNEDNLPELFFDGDISKLDAIKKANKELSKDIFDMYEHDQEKKLNISKAIESISDIFPESYKYPLENNSQYRNSLNKVGDVYQILSSINSKVDDAANIMKEVKVSFRISKDQNKTFNVAKVGEKISNVTRKTKKITGPIDIVIDAISGYKEISNAYKEDGNKVGDKTIFKSTETIGAWTGAMIGAKYGSKFGAALGSLIPSFPFVSRFFGGVVGGIIGGAVGGIVGEIVGAFTGEKGGELITYLKNMIKHEK